MIDTAPEFQIQSHFVRAEQQGGKRRDWSLFLFFRVMTQLEMEQSLARMTGDDPAGSEQANAQNLQANGGSQGMEQLPPADIADASLRLSFEQLQIELTNPSLWEPFLQEVQSEFPIVSRTAPARLFLNWLKCVVGDDHKPLIEELTALAGKMDPIVSSMEMTEVMRLLEPFMPAGAEQTTDPVSLFDIVKLLANESAPAHAKKVVEQGLVVICAYELVRQVLRATEGMAVLRGQKDPAVVAAESAKGGKGGWGDKSPIEIAFTHQGLRAAGVDEIVLGTFPEVFKDGMAARAARLGDVGKSAPSQWAGELGQGAIHGLLSGGFAADGVKEECWAALRRQVRLFNEAEPVEGKALRKFIGFIFRAIGLEILHIELGQEPYDVVDGEIVRPKHRHEHFGFRDGISQPTFDLPGAGTPARNGSWSPVAPGEIYLGFPDEDGCVQGAPAHSALLEGGTYLVFRKLQQDVSGFRAFLASARPGSKDQQDRLAAQFVGRWRNGASSVRYPIAPPDIGDDEELDLNNFRYSEEDPSGRRCPLGAHVRRTNPRDIGGQVQARRHRILRRGMAYGGPFLPPDARDDGEERGMLFIALNARIDVQFELIQNRWINGGEFLSQAGLGKCPITGANTGAPSDQFLSPDSPMPVNRIPAFVHTRGGDYFYAPGIKGLVAIANEGIKSPNMGMPSNSGHNNSKTEDPFTPDNIRKLVAITLQEPTAEVEFKPVVDPNPYEEDPAIGNPMVFIGQHALVKAVLSGAVPGVGVRHYLDASERMTMGSRLLISTETGDKKLRAPMQAVLARAWEVLQPYKAFEDVLEAATGNAIARTRQTGYIDLIHDLAADPIHQLITKVYGVPGPNYLTELAVALPFARQHITELHPDWLAILSGRTPRNPRLATLQVWSILMFSDLIGNLRMQEELKALSMQAASEFTLYLEQLLVKERTKPRKAPADVKTLLEAFRTIEGETFAGKTFKTAEYYSIVRLLLTELVPSALAVIPATFGSLMVALLGNRANLGYLVEFLEPQTDGIKRLIYETNRLSPSLPLLQRYAVKAVNLGNGVTIEQGKWIGALVAAANLDPRVFPEPEKFSLDPLLPGPERKLENYIMFGSDGSDRACFGRDKLAMLALGKFIRAAARLPGLRRVAGAGGAPVQIIRSMIGLPARFARH